MATKPNAPSWLWGGALALALGGCAPSLKGNPPREPQLDAPPQFEADAEQPEAGKSAAATAWPEFFASPQLRALIDTALKNNRELNAQLQEILIAQNEASAARGEYLPQLGVGAGVGVEKVGEHTSLGRSDADHGLPQNLGKFGFGLRGSWELDIWGKLRSGAKAAKLRYLASVEGRNFVQTQLIAELSRSYYELLAIDAQIEILQSNLELQRDALEVVQLQKQAARVTELAVQRFQAEVLKSQSQMTSLRQEQVQAENRINFLLGRFPQKVERARADFDAPVPSSLETGLPADLLDNRPDVRRAVLQMEAAKLDVRAAKAAFMPSLSLDASLGFRSFSAKHLLETPASLVYDLAAGLTAPLLNRAAISAHYRSANARQIQAVLQYEQAVLQAFSDVKTQLSALKNLREGYALQHQQVEQLSAATEVSQVLFQSARADYMEVLLTRRDALEAQMELAETKRRQFSAWVNVYQALGGGRPSSGSGDAAP